MAPAACLAPDLTSSAAEPALSLRSDVTLDALPFTSEAVDDERPLRSLAPALAALAASLAAMEAWYLALSRCSSACRVGGCVERAGVGGCVHTGAR